jgi:hypothetical protein
MKTNWTLESITEASLWHFSLRFWRAQEHGFDEQKDHDEILQAVAALGRTDVDEMKAREIASHFIVTLPRINAIEVKNNITRKGIVIYPEWP